MIKLLKYIFYTLLTGLIFCLTLIVFCDISTNNQKTGTLRLNGLKGKVIIDWDQNGVPHINALISDEDAFFALGYVHALDRFWQMEFQRRIVSGTLSEIFGSSTLKQDEFLRTWGFYKAATLAWPAFNAQTKVFIHSYTQGVNAFLRYCKLPLQFKILHYKPSPWTDIDSIAWGKMMAFDLQDTWLQKITNYQIEKYLGKNQIPILLPPYPADAPTILTLKDLQQSNLLVKLNSTSKIKNSTYTQKFLIELTKIQTEIKKIRTALGFIDAPSKGSNDWVISGHLTQTGKPLLANDPHLRLTLPSVWYLAELKGPNLHVTGATIPGLPGVVIGHNDHIAWGMTNVNADTQDLYIEPRDVLLKSTHEIIKVRGKPNIKYTIYRSNHGPIINEVGDISNKIKEVIAIKWIALMPNDTTVQSLIKLDYAKNWHEFTSALHDFIVPSQNLIYADTSGNIGYYLVGKIPIRRGWSGWLPVDPNQHYEWSGFVPFEHLPHVYNPSEGFIATANNQPTSHDYPYTLNFRWKAPPYRIQRINDLIQSFIPLTLEKMKAMQLDNNSYLWRDLHSILLTTIPLDETSRNGLQLLKTWDGNFDLTSCGATVFAFWYQQLTYMPLKKIFFAADWQEPLFILHQLTNDGIYCKIEKENCKSYLSTSLQRAMSNLVAKMGTNPKKWEWRNLHRATFDELGLGKIKALAWIWHRSIATRGGFYTLNVGTYDNDFTQTIGPGYRQIIDLAKLDNSVYIQNVGQSNNPFDKHYADLMRPWRDGYYLCMKIPKNGREKNHRLILQN